MDDSDIHTRFNDRAAPGPQRWAAGLAVAACCALAALASLALAAGAQAATGHQFVSAIGEAPVGRPLEQPGAVAVDHATGDVFVANPGRGVVDVLSASGGYLTSFGQALEASAIAVDEASGDVYVTEPFQQVVRVFKPDGSGGYGLLSSWTGADNPNGSFGESELTGIAVDNSTSASDPSAGDVYVVETEDPVSEHGAVYVFKPTPAGPEEAQEGEFVRDLGAGKGVKLEEPNGIAVSAATGTVYVADSVKGLIDQFSPSGTLEAKLRGSGSPLGPFSGGEADEGNVTALAVDETNGDLLVSEEERDVVSELNPAGEWVGWITSTPSGPFGEVAGVAVGASGDVYLVDPVSGVVDVFGPGAPVPDVSTRPAAKVTATSTTLKGVIDGDGAPASYHFELGETEAYGGLSTQVTSTSGGEENVQAQVTGLKADTRYYFRLVASNQNGTSCAVGRFFTTEGGEGAGQAISVACQTPPASIDDESTTAISATGATLQAQINPHGHNTTYQFQYGTEDCRAHPSACTRTPSSPAEIGAGESAVQESAELNELKPGTTYYYRALATNTLGTTEGIERTFRTPPSTAFALPDHRAWEMVTPPNKHGAAVEALTQRGAPILAAEDGNALTYVTSGAITENPEGNRTFEPQQVLATRTADGWSSQDITTPENEARGARGEAHDEYQIFSPDLSLALLEPLTADPPLGPGVTQRSIYLRDNQPLEPHGEPETALYRGAQEDGAKMSPPNPGYLPLPGGGSFLGATPELANVVFQTGEGLYEWSNDELKFVSELPEGGGPVPGATLGFNEGRVVSHAISSDGTRVIWTSAKANPGHLYMTDTATGQTLQLDRAQGVGEAPEAAAQFQAASSDGSRVFFTDEQRLTPSAEPAEPGESNMYECEVHANIGGELECSLRDLTVALRPGESGAVQGQLLGSDEEGSSVYLVAEGILAANENGTGETAQSGADNLYALNYEGASWTTTFIAELSTQDRADWDRETVTMAGEYNRSFQTARVSPNGRHLAFMSARSLTGYDNEDISSQHPEERMDEEVYLYDATSASLTCVSCDPTGALPVGVLDTEHAGEGRGLLVDRSRVWAGHWLAANIPGWTASTTTKALFQSRYLTNEGRIFFDSADALVPQVSTPTREEQVGSVTQKVGVENVYEYEPAGVGDCESPTGGCVALISSGSSPHESAFLEASPSGDDVFFLTAAALLPQDTDTAFDIYDARVCTAQSPCLIPPASAPAGCESSESCRPASPPVRAPLTASGSATFSGPGNATPPKQGVKAVKVTVKPKPLTRAQKLALALKSCRTHYAHFKRKRQACEAHARKLYEPRPKGRRTHAKTSRLPSAPRGRP